MRSRKRGVTLTDLVVVMAITLMLAVMFLPALSQAREKSGGASCTDNLKQLGLAGMMYMQDHDEYFPGGDDTGQGYPSWLSDLAAGNYVSGNGERYRCPDHKEYVPKDIWRISYGQSVFCGSHGLSKWWSHSNHVKLSEVQRAHEKIWIADNYNSEAYPKGGYYIQPSVLDSAFKLGNRHSGGANILWCDGHVSHVNKEEHADITSGWGLPTNPVIDKYWKVWAE